MKTVTTMRVLSGALVTALGIALTGCGGGGSSTPSVAVGLGGVAAAGIFKKADVKVYDATTLDMTKLATAATLVPATTTGNDGKYSVTLPAGFNKPVLIMVSANAGSSMKDEVFGDTPVADLTLCSVVPTDAISGANLTGHVTPYTNLMCEIVKNKVGKSDVNAAINQARSLVNQLNGNADPLTSDPVTDPAMVLRLAAVSNIANVGGHSCASAVGDAAKIKCGIETLAGAIAPMASGYDTASATPDALALNDTVRAALKNATDGLDTTVVAGNTGLVQAQLDEKKTAASSALQALHGQANLTPPASAVADGISQAKQFFANLRTGIWPYANDDQTGFLDTEGDSLQTEVDQIGINSMGGLNQVTHIVSWADQLKDGDTPSGCSKAATTTTCYSNGQPIVLANDGTSWSMDAGNMVGAIAFNAAKTEMTLNGYVRSLTKTGVMTRVGRGSSVNDPTKGTPLKMTRTSLDGDMYRYTVEGTMKNFAVCNAGSCSFDLAYELAAGSQVVFHDPVIGDGDITKSTANFTGIISSANYRFSGQFVVSSLQAKTTTYGSGASAWTEQTVKGGNASFTGTVSGIGIADNMATNDFDLLVGKLEANVDGTNYDPDLADSETNTVTGTLTFTGTVFKSVADPGLKLVMSMSQTGWDKGSMTVSYNDYNKGISITGSGTYDDHSATTQYLTVFDGNGISVKIGSNSTTQVMKGATVLANINGGRVTYVDGTYESLM
ncbi:MAG: hypothetical protein Q8M09_16050 [Pseudomonadota bacterium]|nr:hypothetical protein [Pseudomonadota bacterium]MDP2351057.1 hypothetical protein [Pseudomonadota bacterium]